MTYNNSGSDEYRVQQLKARQRAIYGQAAIALNHDPFIKSEADELTGRLENMADSVAFSDLKKLVEERYEQGVTTILANQIGFKVPQMTAHSTPDYRNFVLLPESSDLAREVRNNIDGAAGLTLRLFMPASEVKGHLIKLDVLREMYVQKVMGAMGFHTDHIQ